MTNNNKNIEAIYELSPMQQGMLFHSIYNEASANYFEQLSATLVGPLDIEAFKVSWEKIIKRYSVLRTSFVYKKLDKHLQVVHKSVDLPFKYYDWSWKNQQEQIQDFNDFLKLDRQEKFNLNKAPLLRITLLNLGKDRHKLVWSHHHILFDGWSLPIIFKDLFSFYESHKKGQPLILEDARPFSYYINYLKESRSNNIKSFWKDYLKGFNEKTPLNLDKISSDERNGYVKKTVSLRKETSKSLSDFARHNQITINILLQSCWALLLRIYSGNDDVIFGSTFSGRPADIEGAEKMVGLFINTLPVRAKIDPKKTFSKWVREFGESYNKLRDFEHSSLADIQKLSDIPSKQNLFDSLFVFENYPVDASLKSNNSSIKIEDLKSFEETNYPLTIISAPGKIINIDAAYDSSLIDEYRIDLLLNHYKNILEYISKNPEQKIFEMEYLTNEEREFLLPLKFSEPLLKKPHVVINHFEEIVKKYPDRIALRFRDEELTYGQLNIEANKLANLINTKNIGPEDLVAVYLNRGFEMVISILAILKTGAAYVPIDPNYPKDRVEYILFDSNASLIISESKFESNLSYTLENLLYIDKIEDIIVKSSSSNLDITIFPENVVYVIYTSGSTGKPKGTLLQNKSVINFIADFSESIGITEESRVLQFASIGFDASVPEIFSPLLNGGSVHLTSADILEDLSSFTNLVIEGRITTLLLPPSVLSSIPYVDSPYLKTVLSAGEACNWDIVEKWSAKYKFINGYGPTEASVGCTWGNYSSKINTKTVPIGIPIFNVKIYVLDKDLKPVPFGIPGELFVGEDALARGYLGKPDLTAAKFIPNPYSYIPGERIYQTRDLVKVLPDGQLEFLGRIDNQIKLRGFRIELEEIENVINQIEGIKQSVVILQNNNDKKLVAFVVASNNDAIDIDYILTLIRTKLPSYMIPSHFEIMDKLPLNASGKIDRKKLESFEINLTRKYKSGTKTLSATEDLLSTLFKNVLDIDTISLEDNFFELGGHSLKATQLVSRIREAFQMDLPINIIFEADNLSDLAKEIDKIKNTASGKSTDKILRIPRNTNLPLSFAQQRMWFLQKFDEKNTSNNIFNSFSIKGSLDINTLEYAINKIIERHEILRTYYSDNQGQPFQKIMDNFEYKINLIDLSSFNSTEQVIKINSLSVKQSEKVFDLTRLPLFEILLIKLSEESFILLMTLHHIISDGWSVSILNRELSYYYKSKVQNLKDELPELEIQYADFAQWQRDWLSGENLERQLNYWKKELDEIPDKIDLPVDRPRPAVQTFNGAHLSFYVDNELNNLFSKFTVKYNLTPFMLSLAVFKILLYKYSNQGTIVVGTPIANRNKKEIENLIGFFVNTLAIRTDFTGSDKLIDIMKNIREKTLQAYLHQDLPFEQLVDKLKPNRDMSISPIFQVAFVFQDSISEKIDLPDLSFETHFQETNISKYDITLYMHYQDNRLSGTFEFNTDLFETATIERFRDHFIFVLESAIRNSNQKLQNLSILTKSELRLIKNLTQLESQLELKYETVLDAFYHQVEINKNDIALTFSEFDNNTFYTEEFTYDMLNRKSNQLAKYLLNEGIKSEDMAAILLPRSFDLIIALFAVMKAGAAFIPVDPNYPEDRIDFMLKDSNSRFIITHENILDKDKYPNSSLVEVDKEFNKISYEPEDNIIINIDGDNLAYAIYTSGSTGQPKGTLLSHKGLVNLANVQKKEFKITRKSRILQFSSLSFDAFVWETVMALLNGASLNLVSQEIISSHDIFVKLIQALGISTVTLPPSYLSVIHEEDAEKMKSLRTLVVAGEKCTKELVDKWADKRQFVNAYGPTETTVCATMFSCSKDMSNPPIGKAINGFDAYILDKFLNPVPIGVPGELYITGIGLARGYHKLPDLTAEKFLPNPFSSGRGALMYKSGDLVKYLPSGDIEFLGRVDNQVKFRGFRIELGEIESVISNYPLINDTLVLLRDDLSGPTQLVAYIIAKNETEINIGDLRTFLRKKLPEYMIPVSFMILDRFPMTPSNKIDMKSLPIPGDEHITKFAAFVDPRNDTERIIADIGKELLGIDKMGVFDNFFELGGHSLLATQFVSRIKTKLNKEVSLKMLFENPTVAELTEKLTTADEISDPDKSEIKSEERGDADLTDLLNQLESMSDDEVKELLEKDEKKKG